MKKILSCAIFLIPLVSFAQGSSEPSLISKMGIVAELMSIKMNAEVGVSMVVFDTSGLIKKKDKNEILEEYNRLRVFSTPLIAQFIADISRSNSLKSYNKIDKLLSQSSISEINLKDIKDLKIQGYIENFQTLHNELIEFYTKAYAISHIHSGNPKLSAVGDIVGVFTAIETAVKDFKEIKGKKVDKMIAILDATQIADIYDLLAGTNGKTNKKKDDKVDK